MFGSSGSSPKGSCLMGKFQIRHGASADGKLSGCYRSWIAMKSRCYQMSSHNWNIYGGRGITVCDRWNNSFEAFREDMGERPDGMSLDRIDSNGNYEPSNCRWASSFQQNQNSSNAKPVTFNGETLVLSEWSRRIGGDRSLVHNRLKRGWNIERAVTEAPRGR